MNSNAVADYILPKWRITIVHDDAPVCMSHHGDVTTRDSF